MIDYNEEDYPEISAEVDEEAIRKAANEGVEPCRSESELHTRDGHRRNEKKKEKSLVPTEGRNKSHNGRKTNQFWKIIVFMFLLMVPSIHFIFVDSVEWNVYLIAKTVYTGSPKWCGDHVVRRKLLQSVALYT